MSRRRAKLYALLVSLPALFALPAAGVAATGGASIAPVNGNGNANGNGVQAGNVTVSATSDGITLITRASALLRNQLSFTGAASASRAGETVQIERLGHETNWQWAPTARGIVARDGSFSASWQTNHIGRFAIRAVITQPTAAAAASAPPTVTVTVYRMSLATQYGPGFYGQSTACGETLRPSTLGVANRTLKCGTQVAIYYQGRTLVVPVIDRGPYANGADWDLTEATGRALGIAGTARIGAVSLPRKP